MILKSLSQSCIVPVVTAASHLKQLKPSQLSHRSSFSNSRRWNVMWVG